METAATTEPTWLVTGAATARTPTTFSSRFTEKPLALTSARWAFNVVSDLIVLGVK